MTEVESHRVLQFRCAETGRRFIASFARYSATDRFHFVSVMDEEEYLGPEPSGNPAALLEGAVQRMMVPVSSIVANAASAANRLLQRFQAPEKLELDKPGAGSQKHAGPAPTPQPRRPAKVDYDISEFDFTGFYCPCCGHGKDKPVQSWFFRCGRCREYICGARIRTLPDGRKAFACHDRCGSRGVFDSTGSLTSMSGVGFDKQSPSLLDGKSRKQLGPGSSVHKDRK